MRFIRENLSKPHFKAMLVGGSIAAAVTLIIHFLALIFGRGETQAGWALLGPWFIITAPAYWLIQTCGFEWEAGSVYQVSMYVVALMVAINSTISAIVGLLITKVIAFFRSI